MEITAEELGALLSGIDLDQAMRYALNRWEALTRFLEDGDLEIDNGATERPNRDVAIGRIAELLPYNWKGGDGGMC